MNNFETLIVESILIDTQTELNEGILDALSFRKRTLNDKIASAHKDQEVINLYKHYRTHPNAEGIESLAKKTPSHVFEKLASSYFVNDRVNAATHGPHGVKVRLATDVNPKVKMAVVRSTPSLHHIMSSDNAPIIRNEVASTTAHPNVLNYLASDMDPRVATSALERAKSVVVQPDVLRGITDSFNKRHPKPYENLDRSFTPSLT